jgi:hypothetical protein
MKAFVVMKIAIQLTFRLGGIGLVIRLSIRIELVALVVAPRVGSMFTPIAQTDPAKVMGATATSHVL